MRQCVKSSQGHVRTNSDAAEVKCSAGVINLVLNWRKEVLCLSHLSGRHLKNVISLSRCDKTRNLKASHGFCHFKSSHFKTSFSLTYEETHTYEQHEIVQVRRVHNNRETSVTFRWGVWVEHHMFVFTALRHQSQPLAPKAVLAKLTSLSAVLLTVWLLIFTPRHFYNSTFCVRHLAFSCCVLSLDICILPYSPSGKCKENISSSVQVWEQLYSLDFRLNNVSVNVKSTANTCG